MNYITLAILFLFSNALFGQMDCKLDSAKRERITSYNIPNAYTCYMEMTRGSTPRYGTGFLIHPRVILTAGHNLAWYPTGKVNTVKVYFGSIDSANYLASDTITLIDGVNKFFNSGYCINGKIKNDYSIIILPDSTLYKKLGGCFFIEPVIKSKVINTPLNITGSPGDKNFYEIWTDSTENIELNNLYIRYDMFTEVRNSGSPVWIKNGENYQAIGVHSRSFGNCNAAVLLNDEVLSQIKKWCKKAGVQF